jgi:dedicated sortase system histidine kinase
MTLRAQLLLITALVLALPLSGWQFARQVESTLRAGHAKALERSARTVARQLAESDESWPDHEGAGIYVHTPESAPFIDGYSDDWRGFLAGTADRAGSAVQVSLAEYNESLYLLFEVESDRQVFSEPGLQDGDRVQIEFQRSDGSKARIELAPLAPGFIETRGRNPEAWPRIQGYWQSRARGWTLELQLSGASSIQALEWTVIDVRDAGENSSEREFSTGRLQPLIRTRPPLTRALHSILPDQTRAWVTLPSAWVIAQADRSSDSAERNLQPGWIDTLLFEGLASDSIAWGPAYDGDTIRIESDLGADANTISTWTTQTDRPGVRLTVISPIETDGRLLGRLVMEQDADQLLLDSNRAVLRLLGISLAVFVGVALVLLGYATWLSERVRRLRDGLEASVGEDGQVRQGLAASKRSDELGDLGRSVSRLLTRLREHQNYLRTLADKLAHELRTPLAMIRSSLDNLEAVDDPAAIERYRQRAVEGSDRLNRIFQAMSQAARIEESLSHEDFETLVLNDYLNNYLAACRDAYPQRRFRLIQGSRTVSARMAPDLLAQLLDKLIDNAVDFSPENSIIRLRLRESGKQVELDIENDGPPLPDDHATLFDSMVSLRDRTSGKVHLGLGLSIVRLIAEHHGGTIQASNIGDGVRFRLCLPTT